MVEGYVRLGMGVVGQRRWGGLGDGGVFWQRWGMTVAGLDNMDRDGIGDGGGRVEQRLGIMVVGLCWV